MDLTKKNFCPNIKNDSDSLRTRYICELNGQICPKVDYSSGKALPSAFFLKDGCELLKKEEMQPEQIIPKKIEKIQKIEDVQPIEEVQELEIIQEPIEEKVEEVKEKKETKPQTKKTNNKKKNYKKNK